MIWLAANTNPAGAAVLAFEWDVSAGLFHLTVIGVAVLILWAGVNWAERLRVCWQLRARNPQALLHELCRAHGLSRAERQLVTVISQDLPREKCCRVFIDPHTIERFARANPADADECNDLARRLFGAF